MSFLHARFSWGRQEQKEYRLVVREKKIQAFVPGVALCFDFLIERICSTRAIKRKKKYETLQWYWAKYFW